MLYLVIQFFRVPTRMSPEGENLIICPADVKVVVIEEVEETEYFHDKRIQISIFMSPMNVHANWNPISGKTMYYKYHPGKFLFAWHPKSSTENERSTVVTIQDKEVQAGSEFGFIKFGSRIDVFLPIGTEINVKLDQVVQGKTTIIGKLNP